MSRECGSKGLSRREFVHLSATSAGVLAAGGLSLLSACGTEPTPLDPLLAKGGKGGGGGKPKPTTRNPLNIPSTVSPGSPTAPLVLNAGPASVDMGLGNQSAVWAYNGELPGPTIVANRGGAASIQLENGLADETITHWHGMIIDDLNDGHPRFAIPPGGTYSYDFPIVQRAALNWYHPHPHGKTGEQVNLGLAGAFIIRDNDEPATLPADSSFEVPLIIRDAKFDKQGNLLFQTKRSGFEGNTPLVNGTVDPTLTVEPAVYRFRVLNGANARIFRLALDNDVPFHMIGNDGGLLERRVPISEIDAGPAERLDLLVDFRGLQGATVMLRDLRSGWDLLEFVVSAGPDGSDLLSTLPSQLSTIPPLQSPAVTREFAFEGMSRINGREFEMLRTDEEVPFAQTERWVFSTKGNAPHPVHVHAAPFQVVSRTGGRGQIFPWEQGWKDSVLLEDGETVEVLVRFDHQVLSQGGDSSYLMHCHKLSHEDAGMMMNFRLV